MVVVRFKIASVPFPFHELLEAGVMPVMANIRE
jgi:hypothetical protein